MPACPNCGRQTLRTKDWACQWCGYPLLSKSYKKIDKTFKELQEERSGIAKAAPPEPEPAFDLDSELGLAPEAAPQPESAPAPEPLPEPELAPEAAPQPELAPAAEPVSEPEPTPAPEPEPESIVEPEAAPEPEPAPESEAAPEPEAASPPQPEAELESSSPPPQISPPEPAPQLSSQPQPGSLPEPEPPPVVAPSLDTISDGSVLSVDELDALFKADRLGAHEKLSGKTVVIKGFVEKVFIRDHIDVRYIVLTGARKKVIWPVRCTFGKENVSQMSRLNNGQEVSVRGKYDSYGKNIIFKDCVLT